MAKKLNCEAIVKPLSQAVLAARLPSNASFRTLDVLSERNPSMADNLYSDTPDRSLLLTRFSRLPDYLLEWENTFGEPNNFKTPQDGLELYSGVLEEIGKFAAQEIKPHASQLDSKGVHFESGKVTLPETLQKHLKRFVELGVFSAQVSRKHGGFNLPQAVQILGIETVAQACPNTGLTLAAFSMASFVSKWGNEEQKARILPKLMENSWQTAMALTEPDAANQLLAGLPANDPRRTSAQVSIDQLKSDLASVQGAVTKANEQIKNFAPITPESTEGLREISSIS